MTWRGSTDVKDRIFGALVYALPLIYVLPFGQFLLRQFPALGIIYVPLAPLITIYQFPFAGIIIFFVLFLAVVRNERISYFIRFNTMQAILIDILLVLCDFLLQILGRGLGVNLLTETLYNVVFLGTLVTCFYSIIQSALGRFAEIPTISEAVYSQVR
ncbi:MAG: Tic20 family protein [Cyanophyceae cyanobacterium]